jgi:putative ABC transport system permease protein
VIGLYGLLAYAVTTRIREIGIRLALGANPHVLTRSIMRRGLLLTVLGLSLGVPAALFLDRTLRTLLFQIDARDPLTFAAAIIMFLVVATVACRVPARRILAIDPVAALRSL